ncbi:unnamed protein product [Spirodela intermedia]|uniref:Uncharacterized protein n=1 Tax=Spirodela intermedia TaxID=51605 RepID=A0A7I8K7V1_SPIIN|nr:unnamed protein product [Spirodela intermedia]
MMIKCMVIICHGLSRWGWAVVSPLTLYT